MFCPKLNFKNPPIQTSLRNHNSSKIPSLSASPIQSTQCSYDNKPPIVVHKSSRPRTHIIKPIGPPSDDFPLVSKTSKKRNFEKREHFSQVGSGQMSILCGFGYWVQGFRGLPWLALNFHMANSLNMHPSSLQLVQITGTLPMVLKPLYGVLSDSFYIGDSHRIPYICVGVLLQVLSWGPLALIPVAGETLPTLMACVLLSNLGASITEVAKDALVTEYGQIHKVQGLQSYAFMALATGGLLGNLLGGFFLLKTKNPKSMFLFFTILLSVQLAFSLSTRESSLGLPEKILVSESDGIRQRFSNLVVAIGEEAISRPLIWIVASISMVPTLSGSIFCYQTQFLNLDPWIIGMSKVTGQLMLLCVTLLYDRYWRSIPLEKFITTIQGLYAFSLLLDLFLVQQINLKLGIPNETFALCFSGLAEIIAQFKLLPFQVLFASLAPPGCEGSLTSFLASALCLSSIVSGFLGVGLASLLGINLGDFSRLPVAIMVQFIAALMPLIWIYNLTLSQTSKVVKYKKRVGSKRMRRDRRSGESHLARFIPIGER